MDQVEALHRITTVQNSMLDAYAALGEFTQAVARASLVDRHQRKEIITEAANHFTDQLRAQANMLKIELEGL